MILYNINIYFFLFFLLFCVRFQKPTIPTRTLKFLTTQTEALRFLIENNEKKKKLFPLK